MLIKRTGRSSFGWISPFYRICIWVPQRKKGKQLRFYKGWSPKFHMYNWNSSSCRRAGSRGRGQGILLPEKGRSDEWNSHRKLHDADGPGWLPDWNRCIKYGRFRNGPWQNGRHGNSDKIRRLFRHRMGWPGNPSGKFQRNENWRRNKEVRRG